MSGITSRGRRCRLKARRKRAVVRDNLLAPLEITSGTLGCDDLSQDGKFHALVGQHRQLGLGPTLQLRDRFCVSGRSDRIYQRLQRRKPVTRLGVGQPAKRLTAGHGLAFALK